MSELDKFKRRMIRSVSHLLIERKMAEREVWEMLRKETKCDCEVLWQRMRALTMKKIDRLVIANDRMDQIGTVARLSLTDWMMFDMVLVHEEIDVIGLRQNSAVLETDTLPLRELFRLVQEFKIEGVGSHILAERWSEATNAYNNKGYHCSPMLLQKRWYQLKKQTRRAFYDLWHSYRGVENRWEINAESKKPSKLQTAIAIQYPYLITQPLSTWEEMISRRLVILQEEFVELAIKKKSNHSASSGPDLELIEPHVETITLGDSDTEENVKENDEETSNVDESNLATNIIDEGIDDNEDYLDDTLFTEDDRIDLDSIKIKAEPEDGLSNVKILEATHVPYENDCIVQSPKTIETEDVEGNKDGNAKIQHFINNTLESYKEISTDVMKVVEELPIEFIDETNKSNNVDIVVEAVPDIRSKNAIEDIKSELFKDLSIEQPAPSKGRSKIDDIRKDLIMELVPNENSVSLGQFTLPSNMYFGNHSIEIVDDGIEEEDEEIAVTECEPANEIVAVKAKNDEVDSLKFDEKLLMEPAVSLKKLDDATLFRGVRVPASVVGASLVEFITDYSKPQSSEQCSDSDSDSESIKDSDRIKITSYRLQKPRHRTYTPIQLCKNPDFNTRLKKLTVSFFSSSRNRKLIKTCKPLTIDVQKSFECKLFNGTLYLKPDNKIPELKRDLMITESPQKATILPSAMPAQCLIDSTKVGDINELTSSENIRYDPSRLQRSTVINLPDITQVRKINQGLLTAEVTPLVYQTDENTVNMNVQNEALSPTPDVRLVSNSTKNVPKPIDVSNIVNTRVYSYEAHSGRDAGKPTIKLGPKKQPSFKPLPTRNEAPWSKVILHDKFDDSLLTLDALNKMVNKIKGPNVSGKGKKSTWLLSERSEEVASTSKQEEEKVKPKPKQIKGKKLPIGCCWYRQKLNYAKQNPHTFFRGKHHCLYTEDSKCVCCCRDELFGNKKKKPGISASETEDAVNNISALAAATPSMPVPIVRVFNPVTIDQTNNEPHILIPAAQPCQRNNISCTKNCIGKGMPLTVDNVESCATADTPSDQEIKIVSVQSLPQESDQREISKTLKTFRPMRQKHTKVSSETQTDEVTIRPTILPCEASVDGKFAVLQVGKSPPKITQRKIIIDGSKKMPIPKLSYSSSTHKPNTPLFLGKQKILLTTVKLPKKFNVEIPTNLREVPKVITALPLPTGVQLNLLPNGKLTYTVESDAELSEAQLAIIPQIMAAVEQQINTSIHDVQNTTDLEGNVPSIDLTINADEITKEMSSIEPTNNQETTNISAVSNVSESGSEMQKINTASVEKTNQHELDNIDTTDSQESADANSSRDITTSKSLSTSIDNKIIADITNNEQTPTKNDMNTIEIDDSNSGVSRNLLSDLMEMSGISSDDAKISEAAPKVLETMSVMATDVSFDNVDKTTPSSVITDLTIDEDDNMTSGESSITPSNLSSEVDSIEPITNSVEILNLPELSPVTTLEELKYAYKQNGKFFKLDTITGVFLPIRVFIKKSVKCKKMLESSITIDLTDDPPEADTSNTETHTIVATKEPSAAAVIINRTLAATESAPGKVPSPVKLFKRVHTANKPAILQKRTPEFSKSYSVIKKTADNNIVMKDGRIPVSESFTVKNIRKRKYIMPNKTDTIKNDCKEKSDESSDDEPLAKKAMRLHTDKELPVTNSTINKELSEKESIRVPTTIDADTDEISTQNMDNPTEKEPALFDELMETESSTEARPFVEDNNSNEDQDCILGF